MTKLKLKLKQGLISWRTGVAGEFPSLDKELYFARILKQHDEGKLGIFHHKH